MEKGLFIKRLVLASVLWLFSLPLYAQSTANQVIPGYITTVGCPGSFTSCFVPYSASNPLPTTSTLAPISSTGTTSAATIGTASAQVIAASTVTTGYSICNVSVSAQVACRIGGTAAINTAGSYMLDPGQCLMNSPYILDTGVINCIASVASTPLTVQVY